MVLTIITKEPSDFVEGARKLGFSVAGDSAMLEEEVIVSGTGHLGEEEVLTVTL